MTIPVYTLEQRMQRQSNTQAHIKLGRYFCPQSTQPMPMRTIVQDQASMQSASVT